MKGANASLLLPEKICWIKSGVSERNPGDLSLLADDTLYVISFGPLGICQVVKDCAGYDNAAQAFVVKEAVPMGEGGENGEAYRSYPRHSIDDLLQWGQTVVGASAMTDAERQSYGLDVSE